jgi:cell wall-associated NlpC family hydrolase
MPQRDVLVERRAVQAGPDHPRARHTIEEASPSIRPSGFVRHALRGLILALVVAVAGVAGVAPSLAAHPTQAQRVVHAVESHIGARYVHGSTGPRTFDCSGLVFRSFKEAGLAKRIGGFDTAHGYFSRFRRQGRLSRVAPRVGDLVVYANGGHVGIYVGRGKVVSALLSGVKRHPIRGLNIPFTGILRVSLTRGTSTVVPASTKRAAHRRVVVAERKLPVRANPGSGSSTLGTIKRGTRLVVYGTRKRHATAWLRVRMTGGRRGWVNQAMTSPA